MPVVKITGQGLSAIALSVALLWGCLITERTLVRRAEVKRAQTLKEIRQLQRQFEPNATPPMTPCQGVPPKPSLG